MYLADLSMSHDEYCLQSKHVAYTRSKKKLFKVYLCDDLCYDLKVNKQNAV
jgi:hypothetical protein